MQPYDTAHSLSHAPCKRLRTLFAAAVLFTSTLFAGETAEPAPESGMSEEEARQELVLLAAALQEMARHPFAGKAVYDTLVKPENGINWMIVPPGWLGENTAGVYDSERKTMILTKGGGEALLVHEGFHATQFVNGVDLDCLTARDDAITFLLIEAAAVAHSFVYYKEKEATSSAAYKDFVDMGPGILLRGVFEKAYNDFKASSTISDGQLREKKALEAGGQAVVRGLLAGENIVWKAFYARRISARTRLQENDFAGQDGAAYLSRRRSVFCAAGHISADINVTPPEFQTGGTDEQIDALVKKMGFRFKPLRPMPATLKGVSSSRP